MDGFSRLLEYQGTQVRCACYLALLVAAEKIFILHPTTWPALEGEAVTTDGRQVAEKWNELAMGEEEKKELPLLLVASLERLVANKFVDVTHSLRFFYTIDIPHLIMVSSCQPCRNLTKSVSKRRERGRAQDTILSEIRISLQVSTDIERL